MNNNSLSMYFYKHGDKIVRYGFGDNLVPTMMWVDDFGFSTAEEAFEYYKQMNPDFDGKLEDYYAE